MKTATIYRCIIGVGIVAEGVCQHLLRHFNRFPHPDGPDQLDAGAVAERGSGGGTSGGGGLLCVCARVERGGVAEWCV